jgi:hypothetical protein
MGSGDHFDGVLKPKPIFNHIGEKLRHLRKENAALQTRVAELEKELDWNDDSNAMDEPRPLAEALNRTKEELSSEIKSRINWQKRTHAALEEVAQLREIAEEALPVVEREGCDLQGRPMECRMTNLARRIQKILEKK